MAVDDDTDGSAGGTDDTDATGGDDSDAVPGAGFRHFYASDDSAADDTPPDSSGPSFPVASTDTGGSNSLPAGVTTLTLYLLDGDGKRMVPDPSSSDPVTQLFGAPYRLTLASGQVRFGYADSTGLLTETDVVASGTCTLDWGMDDGAAGQIPYFDDGSLCGVFLYSEQISLDVPAPTPPAKSLSADEKLHYALKYFFMYNRSPNKLAGNHLTDMKNNNVQSSSNWKTALANFTEDDRKKWNGNDTYPVPAPVNGVGDPIEKAVKECDFYKYRGHGYHQLTFRNAHAAYAVPVFNPGLAKSADKVMEFMDETTTDEYEGYWTNDAAVKVLKGCLMSSAGGWAASTNDQQWFDLGWHVSGSRSYGAALVPSAVGSRGAQSGRGQWPGREVRLTPIRTLFANGPPSIPMSSLPAAP